MAFWISGDLVDKELLAKRMSQKGKTRSSHQNMSRDGSSVKPENHSIAQKLLRLLLSKAGLVWLASAHPANIHSGGLRTGSRLQRRVGPNPLIQHATPV